MVSFELFIFIF